MFSTLPVKNPFLAFFFIIQIIADGVKIRVKIFLAEILSPMVYTGAIKQQEAMMFMTKKQAQLLLLAAGVLMLLFGVWRGEADTVFSKAIRLCMECVGIG